MHAFFKECQHIHLYSTTEIQQQKKPNLKLATLIGRNMLGLFEFSPMFPTMLFFTHLVTEFISV